MDPTKAKLLMAISVGSLIFIVIAIALVGGMAYFKNSITSTGQSTQPYQTNNNTIDTSTEDESLNNVSYDTDISSTTPLQPEELGPDPQTAKELEAAGIEY